MSDGCPDCERMRGLVRRIHPLAEGLAIRCEILESARDGRLSLVTTEDLAAHAGDTSAAIYAALDRILAGLATHNVDGCGQLDDGVCMHLNTR